MATTDLTTSMVSRSTRDVAGAPSGRLAPAGRTERVRATESGSTTDAAGVARETAGSGESASATAARDDVQGSVDKLNDLMQSVRRELHFSVDEESGRTVIKVVDSETQEIVRQIPPEEVMTLVERISGQRPSLLGGVVA